MTTIEAQAMGRLGAHPHVVAVFDLTNPTKKQFPKSTAYGRFGTWSIGQLSSTAAISVDGEQLRCRAALYDCFQRVFGLIGQWELLAASISHLEGYGKG